MSLVQRGCCWSANERKCFVCDLSIVDRINSATFVRFIHAILVIYIAISGHSQVVKKTIIHR